MNTPVGQCRTRARTPNTGFFHVDGLISGGGPAQFKYHDGDIRAEWGKGNDVEVVALQNWAELREPIRVVDEQTRTVTLSGRCQEIPEVNARYWVENALEALDAPGEWYLDRKSGLIYYYPMPGEDMSLVRVIVLRLRRLIRFRGDTGKVNSSAISG